LHPVPDERDLVRAFAYLAPEQIGQAVADRTVAARTVAARTVDAGVVRGLEQRLSFPVDEEIGVADRAVGS
ncbi:hypothetical protein QNA19_24820, partial [Rhodococcus fascians]|uniref:hypothetical protein n=1 Tax=Rhodococcoides fascians TaxID=1828 RepID=UPI0024BA602E